MAWMWRTSPRYNWRIPNFKELDGLWQLPRPPVLYFVFGRDAHTLQSNYVVDDNTICEFCDKDVDIDMAGLAAIAQSKTGCNPHFFVINRGCKYWAVNTTDPAVSYTFGPSNKTRVISRLVDGSATMQMLINEELPLVDVGSRSSQNPGFKLWDYRGDEIVEGERFALQVINEQEEQDYSEDDQASSNMYGNKYWIEYLDAHEMNGDIFPIYAAGDHGAVFGLAVVDGVTHLTLNGEFLHIDDSESGPGIFVRPSVPPEHIRLKIAYADDGNIILRHCASNNAVVVEWIKGSYGELEFALPSDDPNIADHAKLRVVKV
ncbi:hypothetical protein GGI04_002610 [Coemansia thaxteri]|nr:hypothetical protein GGI04_002610 [Coemansia thaxteri]KAJ2470991.1 hypothetical protein GGI02_002564 [Coemansia sp. RSA 2322]KAJ2480038.1 hypothetical protein EV174_003845 [Coemansia sp. RSA 2320]